MYVQTSWDQHMYSQHDEEDCRYRSSMNGQKSWNGLDSGYKKTADGNFILNGRFLSSTGTWIRHNPHLLIPKAKKAIVGSRSFLARLQDGRRGRFPVGPYARPAGSCVSILYTIQRILNKSILQLYFVLLVAELCFVAFFFSPGIVDPFQQQSIAATSPGFLSFPSNPLRRAS